MKRILAGVLVAAAVLANGASVPSASAEPAKQTKADRPEPDKLDRLAGLARVWAEAKFFHPAMFERAIDWDGALVKAIPEVEAATDAAGYRAAVARMLSVIGDPQTKLVAPVTEAPAPTDLKAWPAKDVLLLSARLPWDRLDYMTTQRHAHDLQSELARAKVVVIDLRGVPDGDDRLLDELLDDLPSTQAWPTMKSMLHAPRAPADPARRQAIVPREDRGADR
jgi:hypothetical protein